MLLQPDKAFSVHEIQSHADCAVAVDLAEFRENVTIAAFLVIMYTVVIFRWSLMQNILNKITSSL